MEQIEDIKNVTVLRNVPILKLYNQRVSYNVVHVPCAFHKERTPSLAVYPDNHFHCFACGAHGKGAIDFVMKMGTNFLEACKELEKYT